MDVLSGHLSIRQPLDLSDHDAALIVRGVGLVQCTEGAALLLVGEVSVGVGCRSSDDRDVDVDRRVEQVVVAIDLHQLTKSSVTAFILAPSCRGSAYVPKPTSVNTPGCPVEAARCIWNSTPEGMFRA
jgi:hypothetical protein